MAEKKSPGQNTAHIRRLWWQLLIIFSVLAAIYTLLEYFVLGSVAMPFVHLGLRLGIILLFSLFALWVTLRWWVQRVESPWVEADQRLQAMQAMVGITLDIASELDLDKVLQNIARQAADLVQAPFGCLFLYDKEQDKLTAVAHTVFPNNLIGIEIKRGEGVAGVVLETGQPVIVNGYPAWEKHSQYANILPECLIGVPLTWKGEVIGTLSVADETKHHAFQDSDTRLLQPFADLASLAINNARMYSEVKNLTRQLEERDAVKTVQLARTQDELIHKAAQLQGLYNRLVQIQEAERARISRDMHDSSTQLILGAVYATEAAINRLETDPAAARSNLYTVQMLLHQIETEIRETIRNLRPIVLDQEGVAVALKQYVRRVSGLAGVRGDFLVSGTLVRLPENVEVAIYRIVQEALQNISTHASATKISVSIDYQEEAVQVIVEDDGQGFVYPQELPAENPHFGLVGMRERAESIGADFQIISRQGQGTRLILTIPLKLESQN